MRILKQNRDQIDLGRNQFATILFEDPAVMAIDKPPGWMLAPDDWKETGRNLLPALRSSIEAGDYWATSRNINYIRFIHRLDADTSGLLLLAKSPGALRVYSDLFATHEVAKFYLAAVKGVPKKTEWTREDPLGQEPRRPGIMRIDTETGKESVTHFRLVATENGNSLILAQPVTGRTHQIRLHLAASKLPILCDPLYGVPYKSSDKTPIMGLRAIRMAFQDPFRRRAIVITAPHAAFVQNFGFEPAPLPWAH
jgi:23S rRNA pseudouridine1911/1915/1917 synthase